MTRKKAMVTTVDAPVSLKGLPTCRSPSIRTTKGAGNLFGTKSLWPWYAGLVHRKWSGSGVARQLRATVAPRPAPAALWLGLRCR